MRLKESDSIYRTVKVPGSLFGKSLVAKLVDGRWEARPATSSSINIRDTNVLKLIVQELDQFEADLNCDVDDDV